VTSGCWGAAAGIVQRSDLTLRATSRQPHAHTPRVYGARSPRRTNAIAGDGLTWPEALLLSESRSAANGRGVRREPTRSLEQGLRYQSKSELALWYYGVLGTSSSLKMVA
jgi:hypothetical protein